MYRDSGVPKSDPFEMEIVRCYFYSEILLSMPCLCQLGQDTYRIRYAAGKLESKVSIRQGSRCPSYQSIIIGRTAPLLKPPQSPHCYLGAVDHAEKSPPPPPRPTTPTTHHHPHLTPPHSHTHPRGWSREKNLPHPPPHTPHPHTHTPGHTVSPVLSR